MSDDGDGAWDGTLLSKLPHLLLPFAYDLARGRLTYTAYLQWVRASSLEPDGPKAETIPLGHRGAEKWREWEEKVVIMSCFPADRCFLDNISCHLMSHFNITNFICLIINLLLIIANIDISPPIISHCS
ncbi:hypothetical protein AVEN_92624-1 [Araneus ventricosus]|uniref:Uncharacterized protein n=1 Tax=Araneus ventricosus TaxID=182803 RepID=A0A4Y2AHX7_ARAVE|nr:hypothetical protein AVEN_92624-1 [Araneus ventricosus]